MVPSAAPVNVTVRPTVLLAALSFQAPTIGWLADSPCAATTPTSATPYTATAAEIDRMLMAGYYEKKGRLKAAPRLSGRH